jgi:hypothetical protein
MKVRVGGTNEIKYAARNNHVSLFDFKHFHVKLIIKRGNARITKTMGAVNKCLFY